MTKEKRIEPLCTNNMTLKFAEETLGIKEPKGVHTEDYFIPSAPKVFEEALGFSMYDDPMRAITTGRLRFGIEKRSEFGMEIHEAKNPEILFMDILLRDKRTLEDTIIGMAIELMTREQNNPRKYIGMKIMIDSRIPEDTIFIHPKNYQTIGDIND